MQTYPLPSISVEEATQLQFKIVDAVTNHFNGVEILSSGDLGVVPGLNKPTTTEKVEKIFADAFKSESAIFVRGAGTGAIRSALSVIVRPGDCVLVHNAPIYPTTKNTFDLMGLIPIYADYNNLAQLESVVAEQGHKIKAAIVQITRQKIDDRYDYKEVIPLIKSILPNIPLLTDDNYSALKVDKIGCEVGADLSSFSCFKTLGPEGVGVVIGKKKYTDKIYKTQYSGGSQVQGHEAMEALRGLIYTPVALAIQAVVAERVVARLNSGELTQVKKAFLANAQSKVILVEFNEEIAEPLLAITSKHGAAAFPVGSESKYEFVPMMYRISGTFRASDPSLEKRMIRINPMRSGDDTVIRILKESLGEI